MVGAWRQALASVLTVAAFQALRDDRGEPIPEDIQKIAKYVLRHRIVRNYKAEAEGISEDHIVEKLF